MEIKVDVLTEEEAKVVNRALTLHRAEVIRKEKLQKAYTDFVNAYDRIINNGGQVRFAHCGYIHAGGVFLNRPHVSTANFDGIDF